MGVSASRLSKLIGARRGNYKRLVLDSRGDSSSGSSCSLPPRGYVPICVGFKDETKRFMVHRKALGDADFLQLLCKSAEEYDFCNQGILRIPYEAKDFEEWITKKANLKIVRLG